MEAEVVPLRQAVHDAAAGDAGKEAHNQELRGAGLQNRYPILMAKGSKKEKAKQCKYK